jgi:aryl-alcohol dehydrogenase-like predicted oxidoreductase
MSAQTPRLPTATLGRTGLPVTRLGYGAMEVRGPRIRSGRRLHDWSGRPVTEAQAGTILNAVLDAGINYIDTANCYGRSEAFIGKFLSHRRDEFYLATKCGCSVMGHVWMCGYRVIGHVWTRRNLFRGLHESLERMKTDYVDVIQLHNPSVEQVEQGDLVAALQEMKAQGKVRWIGCSSTLPDIATFIERGWFDTYQIPYSGLERTHEQVITRASDSGAGTIIRGGVARGEPGEGHGADERWQKFEAARLDELRSEGETRTAFLLRFVLSHPDIDTTIVGTLDPKHLQENVHAALRGPLPADIYRETTRRLDELGEKPMA